MTCEKFFNFTHGSAFQKNNARFYNLFSYLVLSSRGMTSECRRSNPIISFFVDDSAVAEGELRKLAARSKTAKNVARRSLPHTYHLADGLFDHEIVTVHHWIGLVTVIQTEIEIGH
ncbi:hypothetical protein GWI33_013754 [Rhynchophorus ferrugineus]|uniref:Uncharacterized protein n=1 Tax=Rhynchophorus ferrugineus TaxID=354439 RepID=A0A834IGF4_RHYFE|nr:hypothetical protein GWI33_013754 [Rhynchophorus ferrugineus]